MAVYMPPPRVFHGPYARYLLYRPHPAVIFRERRFWAHRQAPRYVAENTRLYATPVFWRLEFNA